MPTGAMIPVMRISIGATSADRTPPAPKRDQKIGSWDRFMSQPPYGDVDENRNPERGGPSAGSDCKVGYRTAPDAQIRRGLRRHFPPRVGVVSDGEQREPVKEDRVGTRQRGTPCFI